MLSVNILSTGIQVEAFCPPGDGQLPGVLELAYRPPLHTVSLWHRIVRRIGELLIQLGQRLTAVGQSGTQWVEDVT